MRLELRDVRKRFGDVAAVDGVSLDIRDGEFFALLGPSGCGKTTLLRAIAGIVAPDGGRIVLGGEDITFRPLHARNTAMVFQSYALFPHLSVADNVGFGLVMRGERKDAIRARVEEALALVRLPGLGARYPAQLSGGQQQRVALARALVVRPAVLLLDEPLSNLDARLRDEMRTEVREIQRQVGITTILVTHDLHEAFAMSDRLAVMNAGRVEQVGTATEIYVRPATRFVAEFTGDANHFEGRVAELTDGIAVVAGPAGLTMRVAVGEGRVTAGQSVSVMIRPERVRLGAAPARLGNAFAGVVEHATYLGALTNYRVRCGDARLLAQAQTLAAPAYRPGDPVVVEWAEDDCAVRA
ncbi:MAG: ABC transporter ATP-binding protein [Candidatus Rokubacteria bacterium]|nr:ABC transporter ATP-binding protein [Candidatus Rokubacteria bacterium]